MNKFSWYEASSIEEALKEANATVSETIQPGFPEKAAVLKAGGIDLLDLMKEGISNPDKLVSVGNIPDLDQIAFQEKEELRIGANVTLTDIASDTDIKNHYFALHQAAEQAATPQVRNRATLGGNLAQRTRCWYFRSKSHDCYRKDDGPCFARSGENVYHAILQNNYCSSVHSSSVSTALLAFDAAVEIATAGGQLKIVPLKDFFVYPHIDRTRETILQAGELITAVILPAAKKNSKSYYLKMGERKSQDWPIADVAVRIDFSGNKCKKANIVLGAAAPVPYVSQPAIAAISGQQIGEATAKTAGIAAMKEATPLSQNAYKIPIFETIIQRAILATLS